MVKIVDLRKHKTCIFGIQGSGKTEFIKKAYQQFKAPIVFVVNKNDDWHTLKNIYVYQAENRLNVKEEFEFFISQSRKWALENKIDAIIIDEADLFFNSNWDIKPELLDLVLNHRHIGSGIALIFLTRRPQDIPTKIVESSKYLIIFKLEGYNAIQRFKEIDERIPPLIEKISFQKHNFVVKQIGEEPYIHKAIDIKPKEKQKD